MDFPILKYIYKINNLHQLMSVPRQQVLGIAL